MNDYDKNNISENAINYFGSMILSELQYNNINCWIAGGAVRDYFMDKKIQADCDIFFPNSNEFEKAKNFFIKNNAEVKWESNNGMKVMYNNNVYDLVKVYYNNPQETIDSFDFTVCMFAVDTDRLYCGESSFEDLKKRQLIIHKITFPESSLKRAFRYYKRGFTMAVKEISKLYSNIKELPATSDNNDFLNFNSGKETKFKFALPVAILGGAALLFLILNNKKWI